MCMCAMHLCVVVVVHRCTHFMCGSPNQHYMSSSITLHFFLSKFLKQGVSVTWELTIFAILAGQWPFRICCFCLPCCTLESQIPAITSSFNLGARDPVSGPFVCTTANVSTHIFPTLKRGISYSFLIFFIEKTSWLMKKWLLPHSNLI